MKYAIAIVLLCAFASASFATSPGPRKKPIELTNSGLQWLADHQNEAGYWSPSKYRDDSIRTTKWKAKSTGNIDTPQGIEAKDDIGDEDYRLAVTALSLLAFVGDGHTHKEGGFKLTVKRVAAYIIKQQNAEGRFGTLKQEAFIDEHAVTLMAMAELYALSAEIKFKRITQLAVDWTIKQQNEGTGWRYGVANGKSDSSVTAWMVLALKSAKIAELKFDAKTVYAGANAWLDSVQGKDAKGYVTTGFDSKTSKMPRPTSKAKVKPTWDDNNYLNAGNLMARLFTLRYKPSAKEAKALAETIKGDQPTWLTKIEGKKEAYSAKKIDFAYWYMGSLSNFQMGGSHWTSWQKGLFQPILLKYQRGFHPEDLKKFGKKVGMQSAAGNSGKRNRVEGRQFLDEHGSWDCLDPWSSLGGRVYSTAINTLSLEVYYRYGSMNYKIPRSEREARRTMAKAKKAAAKKAAEEKADKEKKDESPNPNEGKKENPAKAAKPAEEEKK